MYVGFGQNYETSGITKLDILSNPNFACLDIEEMEVYQVQKSDKSFKHTWHIETIDSIGNDDIM